MAPSTPKRLIAPFVAILELNRRFNARYRAMPTILIVASEALIAALVWLAVALPIRAFTHSHLTELAMPGLYWVAAGLAVWIALVTCGVMAVDHALPGQRAMDLAAVMLLAGGILYFHALGGPWTDAVVRGVLLTLLVATLVAAFLDALIRLVATLRRR